MHIYNLKKFQKIQKLFAFIVACPKMKKTILTSLELYGLSPHIVSYSFTFGDRTGIASCHSLVDNSYNQG
jgi:hypothetical protein